MSDDNKSSVKKKRRLQLKGPDDEYAKRDAAKAQPIKPEAKVDTPKPVEVKPKQQEQATPKPVAPEKATTIAVPAKPTPQTEKDSTQIIITFRLPVGDELTNRLKAIAEKHCQPIEPILKAARARAAERFTAILEGEKRPEPMKSQTGGEVTRFSSTFNGTNAERINTWFDPFGIGVANDGIKPIIAKLLQEEIEKICDTVG